MREKNDENDEKVEEKRIDNETVHSDDIMWFYQLAYIEQPGKLGGGRICVNLKNVFLTFLKCSIISIISIFRFVHPFMVLQMGLAKEKHKT